MRTEFYINSSSTCHRKKFSDSKQVFFSMLTAASYEAGFFTHNQDASILKHKYVILHEHYTLFQIIRTDENFAPVCQRILGGSSCRCPQRLPIILAWNGNLWCIPGLHKGCQTYGPLLQPKDTSSLLEVSHNTLQFSDIEECFRQ